MKEENKWRRCWGLDGREGGRESRSKVKIKEGGNLREENKGEDTRA